MRAWAAGAIAAATLGAAHSTAHSADAPAGAAVDATVRPRIGLALGGGGARGAAHVGVLEVLERLRVPVDCVAGTSMGALVAGVWAAGMSPAQMRRELAAADWNDMFQDNPDYADLNHRNKRLSQRFLPGSETGVSAAGTVTPPGVVSGQKIKLFFNRLVRAETGERLIEELPLPLSIVATDIASGERIVLRDGSLTQAMRASMSVPGLLAPHEYRGHKLVDGGLVDNLPVREVRERCGADVVIAVNVGTPLLRPEEVTGLLTITSQVVNLLTEQNVQASLASLRDGDVLIRPRLDAITSGDFARSAEAAERGREAAEGAAARLAALGLDEARYALWKASVTRGERDVPRVDAIEVAGLRRAQEEVVRRYLEQDVGAPLDVVALQRDMLRTYGDGWYERVDYEVLRDRGRTVLRVLPGEKSWGPDYLRLGVRLDSNLSQGSTYQLRLGYHRTWLNRLGGELLVVGELGSSTGAALEWHQPLAADRRWFVAGLGEFRRERADYFVREQRIAEYRVSRARLEFVGGASFSLLGQVHLGWRETRVTRTLETGIDLFQERPPFDSNGWLLGFDLDRLDRLYFPSRGWSAAGEWFVSPRRDFARAELDLRAAWPWGPNVFGARASWVGGTRGTLPLEEAGKLGGFLNLTGFASGQLRGDDVAYLHVRAERIIGRLPLGLRGDMRLGVALEAGRVGVPYALQKRDGWIPSLALYLGGETPLGPLFVGVGGATGGAINAYLVIGTP